MWPGHVLLGLFSLINFAICESSSIIVDAFMPLSYANGNVDVQDQRHCEEIFCRGVGEQCLLEYWKPPKGNAQCFETGNTEQKGILAATALAAKHFNERNDTVIKEFGQLGDCDKVIDLRVQTTGWSSGHIVLELLRLLSSEDRPNAIIGMIMSSNSMLSALLTSALDIPLLSCWSTSSELDNSEKYSRFLRTIPTDASVAVGLCKYWAENGFQYASVMYILGSYGQFYATAILQQCERFGMKKIFLHPYAAGDQATINSTVKEMSLVGTQVFMLVGFPAGNDCVDIFTSAYEYGIVGKGFHWTISDSFPGATLNQVKDPAIRRAINGTMRILAAGGMDKNNVFKSFFAGWPSLDVDWFNEYLFPPNKVSGSFFSDVSANSSAVRDVGAYAYDIVASIGLAACKHTPHGKLPRDWGTNFFKYWTENDNATFNGVSGPVRFDAVGNRHSDTANFVLTNIFLFDDGTQSTGMLGVFDPTQDLWMFEQTPIFQGNSQEVVQDTKASYHETNKPSQLIVSLSLGMCAVNISLATLCLFWVALYRAHPVVKASQAQFLALICMGTIISSCSIIPLGMEDNQSMYNFSNAELLIDGDFSELNEACMAVVWLYALGFILTFAPLFAKIWRVQKIFEASFNETPKISNLKLAIIITLILGIDLIIILAWSLSDSRLVYRRYAVAHDQFGNPTESLGKCEAFYGSSFPFYASIFTYHFSLLVLGNLLAYRCRNLPTSFSEGKYVSVALVSNLQVLAIACPTLVITIGNPPSNLFLKAGIVFLNDLSVTLLIFIPKMCSWYYRTTRSQILNTAQIHVSKPGSTTTKALYKSHTVSKF